MHIAIGCLSILYFSLIKSVCLSVSVRKLQVAILARASREMSRISCHEFASQFGLAFFLYAKNIN